MKTAHPAAILATGILMLLTGHWAKIWIARQQAALNVEILSLENQLTELENTATDLRADLQVKENDLTLFKTGMSSMAQAKKTLYESGLALQEEKRLLEKQIEIMTTSIRLNSDLKKISLMREDHSLNDFNVTFTSTHPFTDAQRKSTSLRVTSKERFAHPERGVLEEKDGILTWVPPQVGQSTRSNALGEFVIFTNSSIIIHGPFKKIEEHSAYPHVCMGLSLSDARKLYRGTFIGTKISIQSEAKNP